MPIHTQEEELALLTKGGWLNKVVNIDPTHIDWTAIGEEDPRTRLLATVRIGTALHHLEAREVRHDDNEWKSVDYHDDMEALEGIAGAAFDNFMELEGRTYYVFMTPFSH